jgi:hypothetical protein
MGGKPWEKMIVVVDFDNTLALGNYSHISLLAPNRPLIQRLQELRANQPMTVIKIVTARGGKAGLSDDEKEARYGKLIRDWLKKYAVPFDTLSFKKEYANLYIDDQTIGPHDHFSGDVSTFTGNRVIFTDKTVIKFAPSALFEFEWHKEARLLGFDVPAVLFANDECIITERITGWAKPSARHFIDVLFDFQFTPKQDTNEYKTYLDNIPKIEQSTVKTLDCVAKLASMAHDATFFHGDLSMTNVLCVGETPYLIDPNCKHIFGSYLTDAGKAVFSLIGYEAQYQEAKKIVDHFGPEVWYFAVAEGLRVCKYQPKYISIVNNIADLIE